LLSLTGNIPGKTQTLSLAIFQFVQIGHDEEAMSLLVVTVIIAFITLWFSERLGRRKKKETEAG